MQCYAEHSVFSNPREYKEKLLQFSNDIKTACQQINQLFLHYADFKFKKYIPKKNQFHEMNLRYVHAILENALLKNDNLLSLNRKNKEKVMGICRDSALLLCSVFRSRGIPARLRTGFVNYIISDFFLDGCCLEFYDVDLNRWRLVDTRTTELYIKQHQLSIDFDLTDIPRDKFISAAQAWMLCRHGFEHPNRFGSRFANGYLYMRNRLIHDLALLNKKELLIWDVWGEMLNHDIQFDFFDHVAEFLHYHDHDFNQITAFYNHYSSLKLQNSILSDHPFLGEQWVILRDWSC